MQRRGLWKLAAAAAVVLGALLVVASLSPARTAGVCSVAGPVMLRDVPEASGLAVSRRHRGILWTHNDSGNEPDLFALDASGTIVGRVRVPIRTRDWEDISAGSCSAGECLYVGDIGDNGLERRSIQVYRVPEPDPGSGRSVEPDVTSLTYPDGPHNAEAMFIAGGRVFIVTRDREGLLYRSASTLDDVLSAVNRAKTHIKLQRIGVLGLAAVTDAETSVDGASVAVRTSHEVVIYRTADLIKGTVVPRERIPIGGLREPQGEAVAVGGDGTVYLASEGRPWNRAGRFVSLQCPSPRPL